MSPPRTTATLAIIALWLARPPALPAENARIDVQAGRVAGPVSRLLTGACIEDVNHEIYGGIYSQMIFGESFQEPAPGDRSAAATSAARAESPASAPTPLTAAISRMWRAVQHGSATGRFGLDWQRPFVGSQSQQVEFDGGEGSWGIENQGLNRQGMNFVAGKTYEGFVWARAEKPATLFAALESRDGSQVYAETPLAVAGPEWQRLAFTLTPNTAQRRGRFALKLKRPGSITLGYALLEPGDWGRFRGLPVRRDVAEALIAQGVTVLRYGGSMVNNSGYRWKKMLGPRDRRPPYRGTWYAYSSNGWGILDFMDFCEAAGVAYIPAFNMGETPQDMADFVEYAKGAADSPWGRRRAADGHPQPYRLGYLELGNEERVDEKYAAAFERLAEAIWAKAPEVILVVGDFAYSRPVDDPFDVHGAASRIASLAGQRRILRFAKEHGREVWFDLHVGTDGPRPDGSLQGMFSFVDALSKIAQGAPFKVVVFELNAGNHSQRRALANALAIQAIERDGRIPIVTSANGLQPDGQNDNGWNQGLLFLNPAQVWLQPPGYVTQMLSQSYQPQRVKCDTSGASSTLDVNAKCAADGKTLVLQVVNAGNAAVTAEIRLTGFAPAKAEAAVIQLAGPLSAANTADRPEVLVPRRSRWRHDIQHGCAHYALPPNSFTIIRFE
jgi:hypothetical protein